MKGGVAHKGGFLSIQSYLKVVSRVLQGLKGLHFPSDQSYKTLQKFFWGGWKMLFACQMTKDDKVSRIYMHCL